MIYLAHLGLGPDAHNASLGPGDPVLQTEREVVITGVYQEQKRITFTYSVLDRVRQISWVVTGSEKVKALWQLENHRPYQSGWGD